MFADNANVAFTFAALPSAITGVSFDPTSPITGLDPSRLSFTANSLTIRIRAITFNRNAPLRVNVTFANATGPAVAPLPAPLLCGVMMLGGVTLRKRRRAATA